MSQDEDLVAVEVVGVRQHLAADELVVLLFDPESALVIPILVGPAEASAIATAQAGVIPPRPMTHDLLCSILRASRVRLERVEITGLLGGVFRAELVLSNGERVDSRASDAIALALREKCSVMCAAVVVAIAGVEVSTAGSQDQEVEQFREFLERVGPEDFESGREPGSDAPGDVSPSG
jgi:bifunctional DNase/RNase